MNNLSILDVFLLSGISIGLFISCVLLFVKRQNRKANSVLALIVFMAVLMLLGRLFYLKLFENVLLFRIGTTMDATVFLFGPFVYYFFNLLLFKNTSIQRVKIWFFIPLLLYACFSMYTYSFDFETYFNMVASGTFGWFYFGIEILGITTNSFFVYKSYCTLKKFRLNAVENLSFNQSMIRFSYYFLICYSLSIAFWIIGFINTYILRSYSQIINYDIVWISIPLFIYVIGFYSISQPEIFKIPQETKKKNSANRISEEKAGILKNKLESLLNDQKLYHNSDLSLGDLATALAISNNDVSWLINNEYGSNFYEFINTFRVEEFIKRVKQGESKKHTIAAISLDVGFNSKSTFYKSFKLITNTTPTNFIKKIDTLHS